MAKYWKLILEASNLLGVLFCAICAFYTVATYYGWNQKMDPNMTPIPSVAPIMPNWLILCLLAVGIILAIPSWIIAIKKHAPLAPAIPPTSPALGMIEFAKLKQVRDKTFTNTTVELDGHEYINCIFDNVTFVYQGKAACGMTAGNIVHNSIIPTKILLNSNNPVVSQTMAIMNMLAQLAGANVNIKFDVNA